MTIPPPAGLAAQVASALAEAKAPGCSVAIVDASGPLWSAGFGLADARTRRPATPETVYHLFSGTKLFTAVAVLQLVERGVVSLDDPIERFVPDAGSAAGVTIVDLLSHRSGLKDTLKGFLSVTFSPDIPPSSAAALARYRISPRRPPGQVIEYRNVNYALLGEVIDRVSGLPYRDYVRQHVTEPLGMSVDFSYSDAARRGAATGYIARWDPMRLALRLIVPGVASQLYGGRVGGLMELREYHLDTAAAGGLVGSMPEFGKFLSAQLAGGGGVLSPSFTARMQTLVARGKPGIEARVGMGLGWKFGAVAGRTFLNHEGGGAGFTSELRIYPDAGVGIALAMNQMRMPKTMRAAHLICEAVLPLVEDLGAGASTDGATTE